MLLLLGLPGVFLIGGSIFVHQRIAAVGRMDQATEIGIYGLGSLGVLLTLWALVSVINWLWKRITFAVNGGNMTVTSRVMRLRREVYPISEIETIEYWAEPHAISTVPVHEVSRSRHIATYWVWHVDIIFPPKFRPTVSLGIIDVGAGDAPLGRDVHAVRFRVFAMKHPPRKGERPPPPVVELCRWLHGATGKPVVERTDWARWKLEA